MAAMYKFQVEVETHLGDSVVLVGSFPALGSWKVANGLKLRTNAEKYPLWWSDRVQLESGVGEKRVEYKYVKLRSNMEEEWEASLTKQNRWVPIVAGSSITVHDFQFGRIQPFPFGFRDPPVEEEEEEGEEEQPMVPGKKLKIAVLGSSVACGCNAWELQGWSYLLRKSLREKFGHKVVNVAESGANVGRTLVRFDKVVTPRKPDIVVISLSLGNEGIFSCRPHDRNKLQRSFEAGIEKLIAKTRAIGARPILCGVYPNGGATEETYWFLKDTEEKLRSLDVPLIEWMAALDNGKGAWKEGIYTDAAHPNTEGHRLMFESIDLSLFEANGGTNATATPNDPVPETPTDGDGGGGPAKPSNNEVEHIIFEDEHKFRVMVDCGVDCLSFVNPTMYPYSVTRDWATFQREWTRHSAAAEPASGERRLLRPGLYVDHQQTVRASISESGELTLVGSIAPRSDVRLFSISKSMFMAETSVRVDPATSDMDWIKFYDGKLGIVYIPKEEDVASKSPLLKASSLDQIVVFNETTIDYNIHSMWKDVRRAMRSMREGVYLDMNDPHAEFKAVIVTPEGLASRFKVPAMSVLTFQRSCSVQDYHRVALVPLGHRCALRMILHRIQYDGPCYPFDLTRTTSLADVADIISTDFHDMWNPDLLHYSHEAGRLYHQRWEGLSYAHEVDKGDDPVNKIAPVLTRMKSRYEKRALRFRFVMEEADEVILLRTGCSNRGEVEDIMDKLRWKWPDQKVQLLLFSPQPSQEFDGIDGFFHFDKDLDPDRMNEDEQYLEHCSREVQYILQQHGASSRNLFWCPSSPKAEMKTANQEKSKSTATDVDHRSSGDASHVPCSSRTSAVHEMNTEQPCTRTGKSLETEIATAGVAESKDNTTAKVVESKDDTTAGVVKSEGDVTVEVVESAEDDTQAVLEELQTLLQAQVDTQSILGSPTALFASPAAVAGEAAKPVHRNRPLVGV